MNLTSSRAKGTFCQTTSHATIILRSTPVFPGQEPQSWMGSLPTRQSMRRSGRVTWLLRVLMPVHELLHQDWFRGVERSLFIMVPKVCEAPLTEIECLAWHNTTMRLINPQWQPPPRQLTLDNRPPHHSASLCDHSQAYSDEIDATRFNEGREGQCWGWCGHVHHLFCFSFFSDNTYWISSKGGNPSCRIMMKWISPLSCHVHFDMTRREGHYVLFILTWWGLLCCVISTWQGGKSIPPCHVVSCYFDVTRGFPLVMLVMTHVVSILTLQGDWSRRVLPFWCDEGIPPLVVLSCPFWCDDKGISPHHVMSFSTWWGGVLSLTQRGHSYNKEGPLIIVSLFTLLIHLHIVIRIRFCIQ